MIRIVKSVSKNLLKMGNNTLLFRHLVLFFGVSDKTHNNDKTIGIDLLLMTSDNTCLTGFFQLTMHQAVASSIFVLKLKKDMYCLKSKTESR